MAGLNALLLMAGLALIGLAGETLFRSKGLFMTVNYPAVFVTDVGSLLRPRAEVRWTNQVDYWTTVRANSLGFLDREPPSPERAAESCHVAVFGDSVVEAKEVQISEKFHVRFEEMAARELPALDVTTSAFGRGGTGQVNQLAWYDEYARHLRPRLVVLVFLPNDFTNNFPFWRLVKSGFDPEHPPFVSAERTEDGGLRLRPPDPDYLRFMLPQVDPPPTPQWKTLVKQISSRSWFLAYAKREYTLHYIEHGRTGAERIARLELLSRHPAYAPWLEDQQTVSKTLAAVGVVNPNNLPMFAEENGGPLYKETLAFTAFALDEFKKRAERDGAALVILASYHVRTPGRNMESDHMRSTDGDGTLALLSEMASERSIPVVDQADFINRQGAELRDARWAHDGHWNLAGHRWAAEALLEYLKQNQELCE